MNQEERQARIEGATRIVLRPLQLSFFALGIGSLLLSGDQFGLIPARKGNSLAFLLGLFVFPLRALAAAFSFPNKEPLGATALGLISGSWHWGKAASACVLQSGDDVADFPVDDGTSVPMTETVCGTAVEASPRAATVGMPGSRLNKARAMPPAGYDHAPEKISR